MIERAMLTAILVVCLPSLTAQAPLECLPDRGTPGTFVYDFADVLSTAEEAEFNQSIRSLNDTTPNSIVVVTHPDFCGEEPFEFATGIGEKWGVGDAQFDNGVVVALSPKTEERRGQVFIAVGYGLEGVLPDVTVNRIVDFEMIPEFKVGGSDAYARGVRNALAVLAPLASGEIQGYEPMAPLGAAEVGRGTSLFWISVSAARVDCGSCGSEVRPQQQSGCTGRVHACCQSLSQEKQRFIQELQQWKWWFQWQWRLRRRELRRRRGRRKLVTEWRHSTQLDCHISKREFQ